MELGLQGRRVLITGGSKGLGFATALSFAREGCQVAICARGEAGLLEAAANIVRAVPTAKIVTHVADVAQAADVNRCVDYVFDRLGGVDILVNNADSSPRSGDFFSLSDEEWLDKFTIKVLGPIRLIRRIAPTMMENRWGRIISVSGATSRLPLKVGMPKGASHAALINVTKKLAVSLGQYGITVNAVEPGHMWTDGETVGNRSRAVIRREEVEAAAREAGVSYEEMDLELQRRLVLGRRIDPSESAAVITFLASDAAATITGEVLVADGGESPYIRY